MLSSYPTICNTIRAIEKRHREAFIKQYYSLGEVCEFDWGEAKLPIGGQNHTLKYPLNPIMALKKQSLKVVYPNAVGKNHLHKFIYTSVNSKHRHVVIFHFSLIPYRLFLIFLSPLELIL